MGFAKISAGVLPRSGGSRLSDKGGRGGAVSNAIFLRASVWTKHNGGPSVDPPLIGKENGFQEKDDRSSGYGLVAKKGRECGLRTP